MNQKGFLRFGFLFVLLLITGLGATAVLIPIARADTITVTTTDDEVNNDGDCSLREAVLAANGDTAVDACTAGSGDDVITLPPGTYTLTLAGAGEDAAQTGDLDLTGNVTINGAGQSSTIIDGSGADRIFDVQSVAQISGVTLQNGSAPSGAGINVAFSGQLTLSSSRITGSTATGGGGGIFASGTLTMTHSRIDGNSGNGGGGLLVSFNPVIVTNSEISGNHSDGAGGGIYSSGTLAVINSTLSGNNANRDGGGLFVVESQNNELYNVTISANTADADGDDVGDGGGVRILGGLSLANSLIGGNTDSGGPNHPDCSGALNSQGYNLVANVTGCTINGDATGNLLGVDPLLGPLQNNGSSTLTHALLGGSPAINAANPGGCRDQEGALLTTDQRGFTRPDSGSALCDIGAYEAGSIDSPTPTPPATAVPTATPTAEYWQYLPLIQK
jgi:CSLREA domain-containing protein